MKAVKNEAPETKIALVDLMVVVAEVNEEANTVRFGAKTNDEVLVNMCKTDPQSWEIVKKVALEVINYVEAKANEKEEK